MKQSAVIALMATVVAASGIHNHHEKHHMHEKRDVVTKVATKVEPHIAWETVYVDQDGKRLDGKPRTDGEYSEGKKETPKGYGGNRSSGKKTEGKKKPIHAEEYAHPPAPKPHKKPAPGYEAPKKPTPQYEAPKKQPPPPSKSKPQTPEQIQQGYADQQQSAIAAQASLIAEQEAKNKKQPGVGSGGSYQPPKQPEQPQGAPKKPESYSPPSPPPKKNPPSYSPPSGGKGGSKQGQVTYYAAGLGSCGVTNGPSDHIVALSSQLMGGDKPYCGHSLEIKGPGGTYTAKVQDTCPGCDANHLDLPENFFDKVTNGNKAAGHVPVTWKWLD